MCWWLEVIVLIGGCYIYRMCYLLEWVNIFVIEIWDLLEEFIGYVVGFLNCEIMWDFVGYLVSVG